VATDLLIRAGCQIRPYAEDRRGVDDIIDRAFSSMPAMIAEDRLEDVLRTASRELDAVKRRKDRPLPLVGVAGDIYTRIHPYGNDNLFRHLEEAGLEVWPSPFLTDGVDFGLRKALFSGFSQRRYRESVGAALLLLRKETESWWVKYQFSTAIERWKEPGYQETIDLAQPYLTGDINSVLLQNVAKMMDFVRRGADGVINAISFHCMMGTISASLTESMRRAHGMIPITTLIYSGRSGPEIEARLEAFVNQVKLFNSRRKKSREPSAPWWSLRREK
jgi:predicted nucleotide-binding protein (sugar kinase/HSP70/actin superfamily)